MAVVILGGLVTSTLLNLFVVPSLYLRFGRAESPRDETVTRDPVEPLHRYNYTAGDPIRDTKAPGGPLEEKWDTRQFEARIGR